MSDPIVAVITDNTAVVKTATVGNPVSVTPTELADLSATGADAGDVLVADGNGGASWTAHTTTVDVESLTTNNGSATNYVRVKSGGGLEYRDAGDVLTDIGATAAGKAIVQAATPAAQRTALGSGATGDSLFTAATAAAARTTLQLQTATRAAVMESDFFNTVVAGFTLQAIASGTIGSAMSLTTGTNHPGVIRFSSAAGANSGYRCQLDSGTMSLGGGEKNIWILRFETHVTGLLAYVGFIDNVNQTAPTDGAYFLVTGTGSALTITGKCRNNTSEASTASSYTGASATWYSFVVEVNAAANLVTFYLYSEAGALLWSDTVNSQIPTDPARGSAPGIIAVNTDASAIGLVLLDYVRFEINRTLTR